MILMSTVTIIGTVTYICSYIRQCLEHALVHVYITDLSQPKCTMELNDTGEGKEVIILNIQVACVLQQLLTP